MALLFLGLCAATFAAAGAQEPSSPNLLQSRALGETERLLDEVRNPPKARIYAGTGPIPLAPSPPPAPPQAAPPPPVAPASTSVITSDRLVFDTKAETITAEGKVEVTRGDRRLFTDRLVFDQKNDRLRAYGNVVLLEADGTAWFGDELDVSDDLKNGTVEGLQVLIGQQVRFAGAHATRENGTVTTFDKAAYSPCPVCAESGPLWQIKSERVVWDKVAKTVVYTNPRLEFLGVPIAYSPYLSHPDPTVRQKTGLLTPIFGTNSELGGTYEQPIYVALAPNRDLTVTPLVATQTTPLLALEFRDQQTFGSTQLLTSFTWTEPSDVETRKNDSNVFRGHVQGFGRYSLDQDWSSGFDLFWATDDTYLDRYNFADADTLTNRLYAERIVGRDYVGLNGYAFQGLRPTDDQDTFPVVLPLAESRLRSAPMAGGATATLDSSLVALSRIDGIDTRRISSEAGWEMPMLAPGGQLLQIRLSLRGDGYQYDGDPETLGGDEGNGTAGRLVPRATLDWSLPLIGDAAGLPFHLEPVAMATAAPTHLNKDDIPNEDSQAFEFDETNLFEPERFYGLDRADEGARVAYGVRFGSITDGVLDVGGMIGQSYQPEGSNDFPADSGIRDGLSDYVGRLDFQPVSFLNFRYRFRIDREELSIRRNDIKMSVGPSWAKFDLAYLHLRDEPDDFTERAREEGIATIRVQPLEDLALAVQSRRDLTRGAQVSNLFGLIYDHPCFEVLAGVEQKFTQVGSVQDQLTFKVRVTFTTLGSLRTGI